MALYLGNDLVTPGNWDLDAWWGDKNPITLYTNSWTYKLSDMTNWDPTAITTSAQTAFLYPATDHSAAGLKNPILDIWGVGYHDGSILNFNEKDYLVITDCYSFPAYTGGEGNVSGAHNVAATCSAFTTIYQNLLVSGDTVTYPDGVASSLNTMVINHYRVLYKNTSNKLATAMTSYGFYIVPIAPTFNSTTAQTSKNYINLLAPTWQARGNNTYHPLSAYSLIDAANTELHIRMSLVCVDKKATARRQHYRLGEMLNNQDFPASIC